MVSRLFERLGKRRHPLGRLLAGGAFFCSLYGITVFWKLPLCPIQRLLGRPCLGCGLSRGMLALLDGKWGEASAHHILSVPLFFAILIYYGICLVDLCLGTQLLQRMEKKLLARGLIVLYAVGYVVLVAWNLNRSVRP